MRSAEVTASHTSSIGDGYTCVSDLHACRLAVELGGLDAAGHGVDLGVHIDHVSSPLCRSARTAGSVPPGRWWLSASASASGRSPRGGGHAARGRARLPRASRCGCQKRRNGSNHASAASSGVGSTAYRRRAPSGRTVREPRLAQHAQVLRDRRLRDAELALDHVADLAGTELAGGEQLEDRGGGPDHRGCRVRAWLHHCVCSLYKSRAEIVTSRRMCRMRLDTDSLPSIAIIGAGSMGGAIAPGTRRARVSRRRA